MNRKIYSDVDFLKSLAIISVYLYHVLPDYFKGGFIGVDIFFVVTGFLSAMTLSRTSSLSFIKNRLHRIYPSLSLLFLFVFLFLMILGFYNEILNFSKYLISSSLLLTNFHLYFDSGYFSESIQSNLLYHLWSISIEFQIWLIFSLLVIFKSNLLSRGIAIISFIGALYCLVSGNTELFYLNPFFRFWEAWLGYEAFHLKQKNCLAMRLKLEYIVLIIIILVSVADLKEFYILWLVTPFICFLFLITRNSSSFLSSKIWLYFSSRTYALYLWHVPILVGLGYYLNFTGPFQLILVTLATLLFSELSYRFVEKK